MNKHTNVDVMRAVQDNVYAAGLSEAQWEELAGSSYWGEVLGEHAELAEAFIAANLDSLSKFGFSEREQVDGLLDAPDPDIIQGYGAKAEYATIGRDMPRIQSIGVVTSLGNYVENMQKPGMLHQKTLRSPHPHAIVKSIDVTAALALSGVVDVVHRFNLTEDENSRISTGPPARYLFNEELLKVGDPVVALVAESEHIADEALRLIEVEYEILPAVLDMLEGMQASTLKQWDNENDGTITRIREDGIGDLDAGFADADHIVEMVTERSVESHLCLEPTSSLMWWENGRLIVYYTNQWAHGVRNTLAQRLGVAQNQIRVIQTGYMGSGYGFRAGIAEDEVHSAILARRTGRPIKRIATRAEDFNTRTHRPQFYNTTKLGVKKDGTITALSFDAIANVGAQNSSAATGAWHIFQHLYDIPNISVKGTDVYTNSFLSGAYRCVVHPAGTLSMETIIDQAANEIGMDPVEFRMKNLNLAGNLFTGSPYSNPGIASCITETADAIDWTAKWHAPGANEVSPGVFHGIGLAAHTCSHGGGLGGSGMVVVSTDGSAQVISASNDLGQGSRTQMAMITSEILGIPYELVNIAPEVDTDHTSDTIGTFGSLQTNTGGSGMYEASLDAKNQILAMAVGAFAGDDIVVTVEELDTGDGNVFVIADPSITKGIGRVVATGGFGASVIGRGRHQADFRWDRVAFATHAAEIEVDTVTGSIKILRYVAAHDVGKAMNPMALEQQIEGGVVMALGAALTEEMVVDQATGLPVTDNMLEYKPLSIKDAPLDIQVVLIEHNKAYGIMGAHGIGEPPMSPPGPTISNAIYNAVGVRLASMPFSRDKILAAL